MRPVFVTSVAGIGTWPSTQNACRPRGCTEQVPRLTPEYLDQAAPFIFVFIWSTGSSSRVIACRMRSHLPISAFRMVISTSMLARSGIDRPVGMALVACPDWANRRLGVTDPCRLSWRRFLRDRQGHARRDFRVVVAATGLTALIASRSFAGAHQSLAMAGSSTWLWRWCDRCDRTMRVNDGDSSSSARSAMSQCWP